MMLLGACGGDSGDDEGGGDSSSESSDSAGGGSGLASVKIDGDFESEPEVTWDGKMEADELDSEVLVTGDGDKLEEGDQVFARLWVGNGFTNEMVFSNYGEDQAPEPLTLGQLTPALEKGISGQTVGSRVAVAAPAVDAFGEQGNAQLGIGNKDTVLFVVDLVGQLPDSPSGTEVDPASWAPAIVASDDDGDKPTALDFEGTPKPNGKLRSTTLIQGDGEKTKKGDTVFVNYLGQVYGGKDPFDASYDRGAFSFPIGAGQVIPGWDEAVNDVAVGSRILIAVPPEDGYGEQGQPDAGIKGTDTLYFVIDVLAVA